MTLVAIVRNALLFSFVICCVVSAVLQVLAWARHAKAGIPVDIRALWKPEGYFDEVGLHQIRLARRLLTLGAMAYLAYGGLLVFTSVGQG